MADLSRLAIAETNGTGAAAGESGRRDSVAGSGMRGLDEDPLSLGTESEKERAIAKAALSVAELGVFLPACLPLPILFSTCEVALLDAQEHNEQTALEDGEQNPSPNPELEMVEVPLRSIRAVTDHVPAIENARNKITSEMESMVLGGLASLVSLI